ncbi:MAG: hypothetical protein ACPIOQ_40260, partial [Promethearchaeia archaeon]
MEEPNAERVRSEPVHELAWKNGCLISFPHGCSRAAWFEDLQDDEPVAYQNFYVGVVEARCLERARDWFEWCENAHYQRVMATFVLTGVTEIFPPLDDKQDRVLEMALPYRSAAVAVRYRDIAASTLAALQNSTARALRLPFHRDPVLCVPDAEHSLAWWQDISAQRPARWLVYDQELTSDMIYVGVGGGMADAPFGLFAGQRAKQAILLEAHPLQFTALNESVSRNSWHRRVIVDPRRIQASMPVLTTPGECELKMSPSEAERAAGITDWVAMCSTLNGLL